MPEDASREELTAGQKIVSYTRNDRGDFELVPQFADQPVTVANKQAWQEIGRQVERSREKVMAGRVSCLHYYMTVSLMDIGLLARYAGLPRWRVRLHMFPFFFARLPASTLQKYAEVFNIAPENLSADRLLPFDRQQS